VNLGEIRTAVNRRTGIAFDAAALTEAVNEAVQAIAAERSWRWLDGVDEFTTTTADEYALPADYAESRSVTVNGYPTRRLNIADGDAYTFADDATVFSYAVEGGNLVLYPTPTGAQTVVHRYRATEPDLVADVDEPILPARFHQAIVNYTAATVCDRKDDKRAEKFRMEYERWLKRMIADGRSQQPNRARVRAGAAW
jgi:hypothetical protein